jgi:hypothetical protein
MTKAPRIACGLLVALTLVVMCPAAAAQLPDPSLTGGVEAAWEEAAAAWEDAGGAAASVADRVPITPPVEAPSFDEVIPEEPAAPAGVLDDVAAPAPASAVAPPPVPPAAVEQAPPGPRPPVEEEKAPTPRAPPSMSGSLDVKIRIVGPVNVADLTRRLVIASAAGRSPAGDAAGPGAGWDLERNFGCGGGALRASTAAGKWHWDCGAEIDELLGSAEASAATAGFGKGAFAKPASALSRVHAPKPRPGHERAARPSGALTAPEPLRGAELAAGLPVSVATEAGPSPDARRARDAAVRTSPPAPPQRDPFPVLPSGAASTGWAPPAGGSPSLLLMVLLGALCLAGPRATEPAFMRARRFRSLVVGRRLERPG